MCAPLLSLSMCVIWCLVKPLLYLSSAGRRLGVLHSVAKQGYRKVNSPTLAAGKDSLVTWDQRPLLKLPLLCVS